MFAAPCAKSNIGINATANASPNLSSLSLKLVAALALSSKFAASAEAPEAALPNLSILSEEAPKSLFACVKSEMPAALATTFFSNRFIASQDCPDTATLSLIILIFSS